MLLREDKAFISALNDMQKLVPNDSAQETPCNSDHTSIAYGKQAKTNKHTNKQLQQNYIVTGKLVKKKLNCIPED